MADVQRDRTQVAVPVDVGEGELCAGVWEFAACDHAASVRPAVEQVADEVGDLDDLGVVAPLATISRHRWLPGPFRDVEQDFGDVDAEPMPDHEPDITATAMVDEPVRPAR